MHEPLALGLAAAAGLLLGAVFFGGLWWTLRKGLQSPRPVRWLVGSLVLRTSVVLTGFYLVGDGHWERLFACLIGFVAARWLVTRRAGPPVEEPSAMPETTHATEP
ncbi:ATP synthase subunit I [uncultured Lamprocystis sp.]|jgi:F1F0 ATPase subunit 2|uniref:ATP synthase subunit I n=1 Tax=uncultured Lamprocystis sp. TaxID=543132 RepID=UPI0025D061FC|nr:ATP synthase subunit I [uncultured Lamprocystis sp.]